MSKNNSLVLSSESEVLELPENNVGEPDVEPNSEVFEQTALSPDAEITTDESIATAELMFAVSEASTAVIENSTQTDAYFETATALEEIAELLVTEITTADGTLTPEDVIDVHTRVANIMPRDIYLPPQQLLPSVEAFNAHPRPALESAADSIYAAAKAVWEHILKAIRATLEAFGRLWKALVRVIQFLRNKCLDNRKKIAAVKHLPSVVKTEAERLPLKLKGRNVRNLWVASENSVSRDFARDLRKLTYAFDAVQETTDKVTTEWGHEMVQTLQRNANDALHTTKKDDIRKTMEEWDSIFKQSAKKHEDDIARVATNHAGEYIGCIGIRADVNAFIVGNPTLPSEFTVDLPTISELEKINEANVAMQDVYMSRFKDFERVSHGIEVIASDIDRMIAKELKNGYATVGFCKQFKNQLSRFMRVFNTAQARSNDLGRRLTDMSVTLSALVTQATAVYANAGKKHDSSDHEFR